MRPRCRQWTWVAVALASASFVLDGAPLKERVDPVKRSVDSHHSEAFTADWTRVKPYVSTVDRAKEGGTADFSSEVRDGVLVVTVKSLSNATVKAPVGFPSRTVPYAGRYMTVRTLVSGEDVDSCDGLMQGYIDRSAEGKDRKHYWKPSSLPVMRAPSEWTKTRYLDPKLDELSFSFVMSKPGVYRFHRLEFFEAPDPLSSYEVGRNYIANGGAEQGHYATSAIGEKAVRFGTCGGVIEPFKGKTFSGMLKPSVNEAVAHSGARSFELTRGEGEDGRLFFNSVPAVDDRAFVFSLWVKASARCRFKAGLFVSSGCAYEKSFLASPEWTQVSLRVPRWGQKGEDGLSFYGKVTGAGVVVPYVEPETTGTIWIDDAYASVGTTEGVYEAPKATVSVVRADHVRGVYRPGELVKGVVRVSGPQKSMRLVRRLYDWRNREIVESRKETGVSELAELPFALLPPKGVLGPMTAEWTLLDGTNVQSRVTSYFGVQTKCDRLEPRLSVNVMFGSPEQSLAIMREFGIGGARLWGGGRNWDLDYGYRYSKLFHDAGIRTLFVLDDPNLKHNGKALRGEALLPVDVSDWFARQMALVDAHRGEIDVYEFLNEYNIWKGRLANPDPTRFAEPTMEKYLECIRAFRPLLKKHDPHALLAGCATCSTDLKFIGDFLAQGGGASVDMITEHAYTGNPDCPDYAKKLDEGLARAKAAGVAKWAQTEAGATSPNHLSAGLIDVQALEQTHNDLRNMLIAWAKGLDHYSHFQLTPGRMGTDWNLTYLGNGDNGFEDLPKPALFAFRAAADLIGSARGAGIVELGSGCRAALFERAGGSVAAIWKWQGEVVRNGLKRVPADARFYDTMGRRIETEQCELSIFPVYVVSRLNADELRRELERNRIDAGPTSVEGTDASDPNLERLSDGGAEPPFPIPAFRPPVFPDRRFSIADYGARPDGTKCTAAFARAMEAATQAGGGHVVVPAGRWVTGAVHFRSNCDLHLDEGAVVVSTDDPADYLPSVRTSWEGVECLNLSPLFYAFECTNVAITGGGRLEPKMDFWRTWFGRSSGHMQATELLYHWCSTNAPVASRDLTKIADSRVRPHLIQFNRCRNVLLDGFSIKESPFWMIHLYQSDGCIVRSLKTDCHGHNNDGVDIEMTRNVLVENCDFNQGDDGIVLKAGRNQDAWRLNAPTENVVVRNCRFDFAHTLLAVGSELSGGIQNVWMHDCEIGSCYNMFYFKTNRRRGGFVKNVVGERLKAGKVKHAAVGLETDVLYQWANFPDYELRRTRFEDIALRDSSCAEVGWAVRLKGDAALPPRGIVVDGLKVGKITRAEREVENCDDVRVTGLIHR